METLMQSYYLLIDSTVVNSTHNNLAGSRRANHLITIRNNIEEQTTTQLVNQTIITTSVAVKSEASSSTKAVSMLPNGTANSIVASSPAVGDTKATNDTATPPTDKVTTKATPPSTAPSANPETTPPPPTGSPLPAKLPPKVKIPPNLGQAMANNNPNRSIVLVHVGKAGGITVRDNLAVKCNDIYKNLSLEKERIGRSKCYEKFPLEHNRLANQTRHVVHMWAVNNEAMPSSSFSSSSSEQEVTTFLFTLRNPVDRIHSSYRYEHPANCQRGGHRSNQKQQHNHKQGITNYGCSALDRGMMVPGHPYHSMWGRCFPDPDMETFAQEVLPPYPTINQHFISQNFTQEQINTCRQKARRLVQGKLLQGGQVALHMKYNYRYYAKVTTQRYPKKEVFAVRTEHEYDDMVQLDVAMGGTGKFRHPKDYKFSHGSQFYQPSNLSTESYHKLCCVLMEEIQMYFQIFDKSLNLDLQDCREASHSLRNKCGIPSTQSWSQWYGECRQKLKLPESNQ